jgi:hypothetical protein
MNQFHGVRQGIQRGTLGGNNPPADDVYCAALLAATRLLKFMLGGRSTRHLALVVLGSFRELRNGDIVSKKMRRNTTQGMQRHPASNLVHFFRRQLASATTIQYSVRHE